MNRKIVLIGLPSSGKSKTAGILAQALRTDWVDTDLALEQRYGKDIPWIFQELGEDGFRALEHAVIAEALRGPARIISLGGGAPCYEPNRKLLRNHTVYYLQADPDYLSARQENRSQKSNIKKDEQVRPLLEGDVRQRMRDLYAQRKDIYESLATVTIDAQQKRQKMAQEIMASESVLSQSIMVETPQSAYPVSFSTDMGQQVEAILPAKAGKVLILTAPPVRFRAESLANRLQKQGRTATVLELPDGEAAKQLEVLASVWDAAATAGLERSDLIIAMGGGATTDLGGFAAATWLRGINLLTVPTSLLAMVDAAIGGKTGIDWSTGKNLIGAFYPPVGVALDYTALDTLPVPNLVEGLAEAVKCGFIADTEILKIALDQPDTLSDPRSSQLQEVIRRAVIVKAEVVGADLYESGPREFLNYGHTLAHAIEAVENFRFPHGLAVSIGMVYAAHLAAIMGVGPQELPELMTKLLNGLGLPVTYTSHRFEELVPFMLNDKKVRDKTLRFVLLRDLAQPFVQEVTDIAALQEAATRTGIML